MNKLTFTNLCLAFYCLFAEQLQAQDGYSYTLIDNGNYSFSIGVVPNASASNFSTSVQSYGFTILVPDGVTVTITSSLGNSASTAFFEGNNVGDTSIDGYLITETLGSPSALPAPSGAITTPMVTIQVNGSPTSGNLEILANDSTIANNLTPLKSFMAADMIDDGTALFPNVVDSDSSALSGASTFDFSTLSVTDSEIENVQIYPNPTADIVNIESTENPIQRIEIYNLNGQLVKVQTNQLHQIRTSNLQSGVYLMKLYSNEA
ncbi:MAG: T9SS type A sorting domain-containing protein, partial [Bacteroidota bacterium]